MEFASKEEPFKYLSNSSSSNSDYESMPPN